MFHKEIQLLQIESSQENETLVKRAAKSRSYYLMKILYKGESDLTSGLLQQVLNSKNHRNYVVKMHCTISKGICVYL